MNKKKYFIAYVTQTKLEEVLYHNEIIDVEPSVWVLMKNSESEITYTLISWILIEDEILTKRSLVSYVTQAGLGNFSFKTEVVTQKNPLVWLAEKNAENTVQYVLINWIGLPRKRLGY
jgi:hypothetical protein